MSEAMERLTEEVQALSWVVMALIATLATGAARCHHLESLTLAQSTIDDAYQHDHAHIGIKPTVNDHGAQWRVGIALRRRNFGNNGFQNFFDAHTGFGGARNGLAGVDTDHIFNFSFGVFWICLRQIHLI